MQFFQTPNIDFVSKRRTAYYISLTLLVVGLISLVFKGGPDYGIDFKGGTSVVLRFESAVTPSDLREALSSIGLGNSEISKFGAKNEYIIYIEQQKEISASEMVDNVEAAITDGLKIPYEVLQEETVGPKIGGELRAAMLMACLIALGLILVYISIRFELVFAVGAIVALFHDVLILLGIFSLLDFEISLKEIAAFLTIIGYSLNDTIVVYDRIRENLKVMRSEELPALVNKSINQVLSRTVITSATTFLVVLILFIAGGEVIKGFAFAMMIGVLVGTYSSIFVASPVVIEWQSRHGGKRQLRMVKKKK
ncbi:protein translocase subunit SecF [candidate division KSB1 bacterium]|nr:protein translocase subunit SecF [candidate division KSB1 bacterium]